jgi:hypothetical protein
MRAGWAGMGSEIGSEGARKNCGKGSERRTSGEESAVNVQGCGIYIINVCYLTGHNINTIQ